MRIRDLMRKAGWISDLAPSAGRPLTRLIAEARILAVEQAQQPGPLELADVAALAGLVPFVGFHDGVFLGELQCGVRRHRKCLRLAGALEPVDGDKGFRNGRAYREQAVV